MTRHAHCLTLLTVLLFGPLARAQEEKEPQIINLTTINTKADEANPHPSSDSRTLYFASDAGGKWDLMIATRQSTAKMWDKPRLMADYIQTKVDDRSAFETTTGVLPQYLYFATMKDKEQKNFDIYVAQRFLDNKVYSSPTPLQLVSTAQDEMHPWLAARGQALLFSRKTEEGWRVFLATRKETRGGDGFGEAKMIKDLPVGFHHATLSPDMKSMYLQGPLGEDRTGIFLSTRDSDGWSKPRPLNINSTEGKTGEHSPCLTRNGLWLYFASDRPGGKGGSDIYIVRTADLKVVGE